MLHLLRACRRCGGLALLVLGLPACNGFPAVDLAPAYQPPEYVVPASWKGASPSSSRRICRMMNYAPIGGNFLTIPA